jgi:hypothetical protein
VIVAPSGWGFAIAVLVWFLLVVVGFVCIAVGIGRAVNARLTDGLGYVAGPAAACGWVWLLVRIDHVALPTYALAFFGFPIVAVTWALAEGRRWLRPRTESD